MSENKAKGQLCLLFEEYAWNPLGKRALIMGHMEWLWPFYFWAFGG